jgi:amidase
VTALAPAGTEIATLGAREIAERVRTGKGHPIDVTRASLERIRALDGELGAFTAVREREALRDAEELAGREDLASLPLAGVPVAVKDNTDVAGLPTLYGSRGTPRDAASRDDELVRRLRAAGCIVMGKTALPELAIWPFTEGPGFATRNPRDVTRTCGGSSGGSAVAVATGMVALATATDGGGSIRIPAACCGIVGVKTTPGVVPLPGGARDHWYGLSVAGPLARDVQDAAMMLDVLGESDTYRDVRPVEGRLRIAVSTRHPVVGAPVTAEVKAAVRRVADALTGAGHGVVEANPPYSLLPQSFLRCFLGGIAADADSLRLDLDAVEPRTRALVRRGRWVHNRGYARPAASYGDAIRLRRWVSRFDAVVTPVLAYAPPRIGRWSRGLWLPSALSVARWMGFCPPWNLAGCPSVALPIERDGDGLPVAVQIVGAPKSERTLLSVAAMVEASMRATPG